MALNDIKFVRQTGGLGRKPTNNDHKSGLIFYIADSQIPNAYSTFTVTYTDDATFEGGLTVGGTLTNTTKSESATIVSFVTGDDTIVVSSNVMNWDVGDTLDVSGNTTTIATNKPTIDSREKQVFSLEQLEDLGFASGAAGVYNIYYQVQEFFRLNPTGELWLGLYQRKCTVTFADDATFEATLAVGKILTNSTKSLTGKIISFDAGANTVIIDSDATGWAASDSINAGGGATTVDSPTPVIANDMTKLETLQNATSGELRQVGIYDEALYATATLNSLQTSVTALQALHMPLNVLYAGNLKSVADISTLTDLQTLSDQNISSVILQDGKGEGFGYFKNSSLNPNKNTISALGAVLGAVSKAAVHESILWIQKFNLVTGTELDVPAFGNGTLVSAVSSNVLTSLNSKNYIFGRKHFGISGTYVNDSWTAVSQTSDYATIENNRTVDKAVRNIRTNLLPLVGNPLYLSDGLLSEDTIAYFKNEAERALEAMERDEELSEYSVLIDPDQDVLATSKVVVTVKIVPVGVARTIEVNIGLTVSL